MMSIFGRACFFYLRAHNHHKLDFKISKCIFVRYSFLHKGYLCLHSSGKVYINNHVFFLRILLPFLVWHWFFFSWYSICLFLFKLSFSFFFSSSIQFNFQFIFSFFTSTWYIPKSIFSSKWVSLLSYTSTIAHQLIFIFTFACWLSTYLSNFFICSSNNPPTTTNLWSFYDHHI